jgi:hypothetical protein
MSAYPTFFFEPQTQSPFLGHTQRRAEHQHPAHHHHQHRASPFDEPRRGSVHGRQSPPSFYTFPGDVQSGRGGNSNSLDLDAQERQLVAQLEALRARKAQAEVEKQRQALLRQRQVEIQRRAIQEEQQRVAREEAAHAQQARQRARQVELMRALESARRQAVEIEAAKERERRVQMAKAQQYYMLQHQRAIEEQRQRQLKQQAEQQRLIQQQASRQRQAREQAFWEQVERCVSPRFESMSDRPADLVSFDSSCAPPARQQTPSRTPAQLTPHQQQPEAKREAATPYGLPIEILKMLFGPDVVVQEEEPQARSQTPAAAQSQSTPKPATTPALTTSSGATPAEAKSTPPASQDKGKEAERQEPVDGAQQFIDDLFGAFAQAFSLNDDEGDEKAQASEENKEDATAPAVPKPAEPQTTQSERSQPAEKASASKEEPATPAFPTEAPTPRTTTEDDDDIPVSAADLEAEKAQTTADLIQAKYRQHLLRVTRLEKLEALESKLEKLDEGWTFPETLDFLPSTHEKDKHADRLDALADPVDSASSQSENLIVPPLAFTPTNVPYHAHAQALLGLLVAADAVSSDGDEQVRNARREFVRLVEGKLGEMEVGRRQVWEKMKKVEGGEVAQARGTSAPAVEESEESSADKAEQATDDTTQTQEAPKVETTSESTSSGEEQNSTAIPVAVPDPTPLPRADEPSTTESTDKTATETDDTSNAAATAELEPTASEPAAPETVDTRRYFSESEDEGDQKAEHPSKDKKEQVDEFVVV